MTEAMERVAPSLGAASCADERAFSALLRAELESSRSDDDLTLAWEKRATLDGWNGRVGGYDVAQCSGDRIVNAVELKWSTGSDPTLRACAWDAVKLALADAEGKIDHGFMLAGAPREVFSRGLGGAALLRDRGQNLGHHLADFREDFAFWKKDVKNHPAALPLAFDFRLIHAVEFEMSGTQAPWELRLVKVTSDGKIMDLTFGEHNQRYRLTHGEGGDWVE